MVSIERQAERIFRETLETLGGFKVSARAVHDDDRGRDLEIHATSGGKSLRFAVEAKARITPQTALGISEQLRSVPGRLIPVVYAPVISDRVAEILKQQNVGYIDAAGNAFIRSPDDGLLIERRGRKGTKKAPRPAADPFSPKSSRIVRAMLAAPAKGWQVRELAEHDDVKVSPGLVVKVKRALVEEGYAIEHDRLLFLRDPAGLLQAWAAKYPGPQQRLSLYVRGDQEVAEQAIGRWCEQNKLTHALAGLSAAWRLAPETRYVVTTYYVEERAFDDRLLRVLGERFGGKQVESGANVELWLPFDASVFADKRMTVPHSAPATSPLQTYLDTKNMAGRGEEAAQAVFEKYLANGFTAATQHAKELQNGV